MRFGACTTMDNYDALCDFGYDYIELPGIGTHAMSMAEVEAAGKKIKERGIPALGYNAYCNGEVPIVGDGYSKAKAYEYAREMCEKGAILGIKNIGIGAPKARILPEGYDIAKADDQCAEFLRTTCEVAAEYDMQLLFEALNHTNCNYMLNTLQAHEFVKSLGISNLFMVMDFYHMGVEEEDLYTLDPIMPEVKHLHISGFDMDGSRFYIRDSEIPFCKACMDWARGLGYDETMSIEVSTQDFKENGEEMLAIFHGCM